MGGQLNNCPFCSPLDRIFKNELAFATNDLNPVSLGHLLLIPVRHIESYFQSTPAEKLALLALIDEGKLLLDERHRPDGYNIGINVGEAAGQTVKHLHVHLIPRYHGDLENPRGGVRGVIPEKRIY